MRERSRYFEPAPLRAVRSATVAPRVVSLPTDDAIMAALTRGDAWAADALYERVHVHVERTLRRLLRFQTAELDDLMQASFERIIRFLSDRSLLEGSNLPAWSSAVAANVALDFLRRRGAERRIFTQLGTSIDAVRGQEAGPERHAEARLSVVRLQQLLARMRPKYAETLVLHDILGHDLAEIAELTGASVAATQSRLVRGRKELLRRTKKTETDR